MAEGDKAAFFKSLQFRYGLALFLILLAIAGYFLWEKHEEHIVGYLFVILFLGVFVYLHRFMHRGHPGDQRDRDP